MGRLNRKRQLRSLCYVGIVCILLFIGSALAQFTPTISAVDAPVLSNAPNYLYFHDLVKNGTNPPLTAQEPVVSAGTQTGATNCKATDLDCETGTAACTPSISFSALDNIIAAYKTNLIFQPGAEGNVSSVAPLCVFSQAQANAAALTWKAHTLYLPSWYINVNGTYWQLQVGCYSGSGNNNSCTTGATEPLSCFSGSGPCTDGTVSWVKVGTVGTKAPLQDGFCSPVHTCAVSGSGYSSCYQALMANGQQWAVINANNTGPCTPGQLHVAQLIPYELPFTNWVNQVIAAFVAHYNGSAGANLGYVRFGFQGGEFGFSGFAVHWPYTNYAVGGSAQVRAQLLSWVYSYDSTIMGNSPVFHVVSDMNCVGNPEDCTYADQEAQIAVNTGMWGIGNADYQVSDVNNLLQLTPPGTQCSFPLVPSNCTGGDWAYNCWHFSQMHCYLQTLLDGSTPATCIPFGNPPVPVPGPLAPLLNSQYCPAGTQGLLPFLTNLRTTGVDGGAVKITVDIFESHTGVSTATGTYPDIPANDTLLALSPNYASTMGAVSEYAMFYEVPYKQAFCTFLNVPSCP